MARKTDRRNLKDSIALYGGSFVLVVLAFVITFQFMKPAPPTSIKMATGSAGNIYDNIGKQYQAALAKEGIVVELVNTKGSVENLGLLQSDQVDIALLQSGVAPKEDIPLLALGSLYYEPLWLFYRKPLTIAQVDQLKGLKVAVGQEGSGTLPVVQILLSDNHLDMTNTTLLNFGTQQATEALLSGEIDAAFMVTGLSNANVQKLLADDQISVLDFTRAEAYTRLHPFLSAINLPEGVIDLNRNIPDHRLQLLSPAATLVIQPDFHPALSMLFLQAAEKIHGMGGVLEQRGAFPSADFVDFPLSEDAERFYKSGPPFLQRYMPFWAANLLDRLVILLVPLITLMIPLMKILPPTYRWRIRSRIYRWYDQLREIEYQAEHMEDIQPDRISELLDELLAIEKELMLTDIPKSYAESQYNLRLHIRLIRERLEWRLK